MPLPPLPVPRRRRRRARRLRAAGVLGAVVALGLVTTAAAPGTIVLRPGDTLSELAVTHGTTVAALRAANGLTGDLIVAGQQLRLSRERVQTPRPAQRLVVRRGDTLIGIARRTGTSVPALRAANRLAPADPIVIGQRLSVPGGGVRAPRSTAPVRVPARVSRSAARHRALLRGADLPSKAAVRRLVASTARRHGVPVPLALAVAYHESGFQQRVVSPVDAIGAMQVLPSTGRGISRAAGRDLDLLRAQDNVTAGVLLLRQLLHGTGSQREALAGYYQGLGSIARRGLLPQTEQYLRSIALLQQRFAAGRATG